MSLAILTAVLPDATRPATAGSGTLTVLGTVTDVNGVPVEGATVNITIVGTGAWRSLLTDPSGFYDTSADDFEPSDWNVGNTISVFAKYGSMERTNTTVIDDAIDLAGYAEINVRFTVEIPEFGPLGTAAVISSVVVVFALVSRSSGRRIR